jgi:hypothetical protein
MNWSFGIPKTKTVGRVDGPVRVLYFAVSDPGYPRNERVRHFLESELRAEVHVVRSITTGKRLRRYFGQLKSALSQQTNFDVVVLSEFSLHFFPFSWLIAKRARAYHIVDFFVGLHETEVGDDKSTDGRSHRARVLALVDFMAIRSADACFADTEIRANRFAMLDRCRTPFASLPVGAPRWALEADLSNKAPSSREFSRKPIRLLYYGSYLALHGLGGFIEALTRHPEFDFELEMIGSGPERIKIEALVRESGLGSHVTFIDYAEPAVLIGHIAAADILIGIFGISDKAAEVIANKVWQGLYMGTIVLTRASVALDEISEVAGPLLIQVGSSRPDEIGLALTKAARDLDRALLSTQRVTSIRSALEQLVRDRYDSVFRMEPYATVFRRFPATDGARATHPSGRISASSNLG